MEACTHQVQYNGLCAICGTLLESDDQQGGMIGNSNTINMGYDTIGLTVSREEAERLEAENARRLLKNRKLSLILDLDQTIVHASWNQKVSDYIKENDSSSDIRQFTLPGSPLVYYIKLRPGLDQFLKEIEELYELHIYTMGTRYYAEAVAKEIDPNGSIFKERILSRDESGSVTQKKLQRLFPCDTSMVVVLDDRSDVWSFSPNLIRIKPYEFFVGTGDINSPFKKTPKVTPDSCTVAGEQEKEKDKNDTSITTEKNDGDPNNNKTQQKALFIDDDNELYTMLKILKDVHKDFYAKDLNDKEADVTHIIPIMKKQVLNKVMLTFTADVIPTKLKDPTLSWIWQMASSFGATCSMDLTGKTTHLIAVKANSNKVKAAREYGHSIHVVTPAWLLDSTARWTIQDENAYDLPEIDLENPESTSLDDLEDDSAFEDERNQEEEEEEEVIENVDWDEADREVEDFINESGIDDVWDTEDSDTVESPLSTTETSNSNYITNRNKRKRKPFSLRSESGGEEESGGDNSNAEDEEDLALRKRRKRPLSARASINAATAKQRQRSKLSKVAYSNTSSTCTSGNNSDDDTSSLDDLAGILDEAIK